MWWFWNNQGKSTSFHPDKNVSWDFHLNFLRCKNTRLSAQLNFYQLRQENRTDRVGPFQQLHYLYCSYILHRPPLPSLVLCSLSQTQLLCPAEQMQLFQWVFCINKWTEVVFTILNNLSIRICIPSRLVHVLHLLVSTSTGTNNINRSNSPYF